MGFTTAIVTALAAGAKIYSDIQKNDYNKQLRKYEAESLENQAKRSMNLAAQDMAQRRHQAQYSLAEHESQLAQNKLAPGSGSGLKSQLSLAARLEYDIQDKAFKAVNDYQTMRDNASLLNWRKQYETQLGYTDMVSTLLSSVSSVNNAYRSDLADNAVQAAREEKNRNNSSSF